LSIQAQIIQARSESGGKQTVSKLSGILCPPILEEMEGGVLACASAGEWV
jgi:hypothetical protein